MTAAAERPGDPPDGSITDGRVPPAGGTALVRWMLGRSRGRVVVGAVAGIVWMGAGALLPVVLGAALDDAVRRGSIGSLAPWLLAVAAVVGMQTVAAAVRHHIAMWLAHRSQWALEQLVTSRVLDPRGGATGPTGRAVSLATNDTEALADIANLMCRGIGAAVTFVVVAVAMVAAEWRLGVMAVVGMPLALFGLSPLWRPARDRSAAVQRELAALSVTTADTISGLRVVKGLGGEAVARQWFAIDAAAVQHAAVRAARLTNVWSAFSTVVPGLILASILWIAGPMVLDGDLSPGDLIAFTGLAAWLRNPLTTLSEVGQVWVAGMASARRIAEFLNMPHTVDDPPPGRVARAPMVSFGHVHADGLHGVTFDIGEAEHVALVCTDHRAAIAVVELLGRHRCPDQGTIAVGGVDIAGLPLDVLRGHVAVEPHHSWLFAGSVAENLALGASDATRSELVAALRAAAGDDVLAGADGIDRQLGERGVGLSGGQRQRVALARRLVGAPPVVVLHDPTSALDVVTEQTVAERVRTVRAGRTTIWVTTSPALLAVADRVILLDDGAVTATGTHRDLLGASSAYRVALGHDIGPCAPQ